jgi:hypothetical protein
MAIDASHLGVLQHCMGSLPRRTAWLDGRNRMAAPAGLVVLCAHNVLHFLRQLGATGLPHLRIVEMLGHLGENVAHTRLDVDIRLHEPIGFPNVAVAAARANAESIADMAGSQKVRICCDAGHRVTGGTESLGRSTLIDFQGHNECRGAGNAADYKYRNGQNPPADLQCRLPWYCTTVEERQLTLW